MTLAELYKWPLERNWGARRREALETYLASHVVLPMDDEVARCWARLIAGQAKLGRTFGFADAWIAATALRHALPIVTHNKKHFENVPGLEVISA